MQKPTKSKFSRNISGQRDDITELENTTTAQFKKGTVHIRSRQTVLHTKLSINHALTLTVILNLPLHQYRTYSTECAQLDTQVESITPDIRRCLYKRKNPTLSSKHTHIQLCAETLSKKWHSNVRE